MSSHYADDANERIMKGFVLISHQYRVSIKSRRRVEDRGFSGMAGLFAGINEKLPLAGLMLKAYFALMIDKIPARLLKADMLPIVVC